MFSRIKKVKLKKKSNPIMMAFFAIIFGGAGIFMLVSSSAATAVIVDPSLPQPQNLRAFPDDRIVTVTWDPVNDDRIVGYYITYRAAGSNDELKVRQTEALKNSWGERATAIQLQPLVNAQEYEINVHSVAGGYEEYLGGPLVWGGDEINNRFAVGDGRVSNPAIIQMAPSSARVDAQRQKLTGFFDDFNQPAGPFDELKWNQASNACVEAGTAAAFINAQYHSHNTVRTTDFCDRAGMASRPRATFNTTGSSEASPAEIEFDIDGAHHGRDAWYLDIIPLSVRNNRLPLDITSHNDLGDGDIENPGNIVRLNANYERLTITYYGVDNVPVELALNVEPSACELYDGESGFLRFATCDMSQKTDGLSPLPQIDINPSPIANVRRHWTVRLADNNLRVYVDGTHIATTSIPSNFVNEREYTLHSTIFSYNTGKDSQYQTIPVTPYVQLLHWDNFGFTGPASNEVVHNYLEGQENGDEPVYSIGTPETRIQTGNRRTIIPIPDQIGTLKDDTARLYFTVQPFNFRNVEWDPSWNVVLNGTTYNVPDPRTTSPQPFNSPVAATNKALPYALEVPRSNIVQGDNILELNVGTEVINVHIELPYDATSPNIPNYTQPKDVFGEVFNGISQPPITNCDYYRSIEQDLGLDYEAGKENIVIGPCVFLTTDASQVDGNPGEPNPDPDPPSTNQAPTATISSTVSALDAPATYSVNAGASDSDGNVVNLEILQAGSVVQTCANATTCRLNIADQQAGPYTYTSRSTDNEGGATVSQSVTVTVTIPDTPPTGDDGRFDTLGVNAELPSGAECASRVRPAAEVRSSNAPQNQTRGQGVSYYYPRVDGDYVGTTDEIIQWTSCKWGMDEDLLRAQMVQESYWFQSGIGDWTTNGDSCSNVYPIADYPPQASWDSQHNGQCPESYGISQVRWDYHKSAFFTSTEENESTLTNNAIYSTSFNLDYYGAVWRSCFNGELGWLNDVERGDTYAAGDAEGCQGVWFSGRWKTAPANAYISAVQDNLNNRTWEQGFFLSATPGNTIPGRDGPVIPGPTCEDSSATNAGGPLPCVYPPEPDPVDTTAPTVSILSPASGTTTSGSPLLVNITASDNVGVNEVRVYINGTQVSVLDTAPYSYSLSTAPLSVGNHTIFATAVDAAGNQSQSSTVTIIVPSPPLITGDIDGDGRVTVNDVRILINNFGRTNATRAQGDLSGDGIVNVNDVRILINGFRG